MSIFGSLFNCGHSHESDEARRSREMFDFHRDNSASLMKAAIARGEKPKVYIGEASGGWTFETEKPEEKEEIK